MSGPYRHHLDVVTVTSPCTEDWTKMDGDDAVRFCGKCSSNVYDFSALTRVEAERLLALLEGRICVRLHRRKDGTLVTKDCLPARQAARTTARRRTLLAVALALSSTVAATLLTPVAMVFAALGRDPSEAVADFPMHWAKTSVHDETSVVMGLQGVSQPVESPTWVDPATIDLTPVPSPAPLEALAEEGITMGGLGGLGLRRPSE